MCDWTDTVERRRGRLTERGDGDGRVDRDLIQNSCIDWIWGYISGGSVWGVVSDSAVRSLTYSSTY